MGVFFSRTSDTVVSIRIFRKCFFVSVLAIVYYVGRQSRRLTTHTNAEDGLFGSHLPKDDGQRVFTVQRSRFRSFRPPPGQKQVAPMFLLSFCDEEEIGGTSCSSGLWRVENRKKRKEEYKKTKVERERIQMGKVLLWWRPEIVFSSTSSDMLETKDHKRLYTAQERFFFPLPHSLQLPRFLKSKIHLVSLRLLYCYFSQVYRTPPRRCRKVIGSHRACFTVGKRMS